MWEGGAPRIRGDDLLMRWHNARVPISPCVYGGDLTRSVIDVMANTFYLIGEAEAVDSGDRSKLLPSPIAI